jgi:hypothetical protein
MAGNTKGGVVGLLLQHGEKAAIAIVGFIALWLVYKTTSLPRLEDKYKADKLHREITETSSAVQSAAWPDPTSEQAHEVRIATPINEKADVPVSPEAYKVSTAALDPQVVTPTVLRTDPTLLNAVDVRANGGSGLLAFQDEAIRKAREIKRAAEEQERLKKESDKAAKEQKENEQPGAKGRKPGGPGSELSNQPFDPAHPKRRQVEGGSRAMGVPLQGGERIEQAYWACVVAKVPIREQLKLYQDAFEKAKGGFDPSRDFPQYKGYFVQRAEVIPGKDLDWKPVPVYDGQRASVVNKTPLNPASMVAMGGRVMAKLYENAAKYWAGMSPDVIDGRFSDYILTFPLPPLVGRDWGADATHPDIPLAINTPPLEQENAPTTPNAPTDKPAGDDNAFAASDPGTMPVGPGGFSAGPGRMAGPGAYARGPGMGRPGMSSEMMGRLGGPGMMGGPEGGGRGFASAGPGPGAGAARTSLAKSVDFLLFRFFDFTVEPGKKYKYRVRLALADPNYSLPDNVLAPTVLDRHRQESQAAKAKNSQRQDIRVIEKWSDPSPTVGIPLSGGVKLVDVKTPSGDKVNDEPSATLLVDSFDVDETDKNNAIQAANKKEFRRGGVANMTEKTEYLVEGGIAIDSTDKFHFVTGMTLVDIDGGKKLVREYTSPARAMVMGPSGELYIRNELDDKPAVDYHHMVFEERHQELGGPGGPIPGGSRGQSRPRGPGR